MKARSEARAERRGYAARDQAWVWRYPRRRVRRPAPPIGPRSIRCFASTPGDPRRTGGTWPAAAMREEDATLSTLPTDGCAPWNTDFSCGLATDPCLANHGGGTSGLPRPWGYRDMSGSPRSSSSSMTSISIDPGPGHPRAALLPASARRHRRLADGAPHLRGDRQLAALGFRDVVSLAAPSMS